MANKKLPRHLLPQIPGDKVDVFINYMQENGVPETRCSMPAKALRAIQSEVNRDKIENFKQNPEKIKKPIIISKSGWILDGHHRWLAALELDPNMELECIKFECTINELVALGHKFKPSFRKSVHEATTYSRKLWEMMKRRGEVPENAEYPGEEETRLIVRKTLWGRE